MALAPTLYNPGSHGQDARYDITGLPFVNGAYTDGTYQYDSNGLDLSGRPPDWSAAKPADQMDGGGGGGGGGGLGSFGPQFDQLMSDLKAQSVSDKASRDAAIQRSFINFGLGNFDLAKAAQTTGIGDLASILDPQTLELAKNNPFSVQARINQGLADQQQQNRVQLRQRGAVRSGEAGYLGQKAQTAYDTDVYDSGQKLLDYLSGAQSGFAQAERERQMQAWQAALAAAANYGGYGGGGGGYSAPAPQAAPSAPPTYVGNTGTWTQVGGPGGEWTKWAGKAQ